MRVALGVLLALLAALVVAQLLLPRYAEHRIENRLTRQGGVADVSLHVFPAVRLLRGDGDRLEIRASDLRLDLDSGEPRLWKRLDRFDAVDIRLARVRTGPLRTERFALYRPEGSRTYLVDLHSEATPAELVRYGAARVLPAPLSAAFSGLAGTALPGANRPLRIVAEMRIASQDGEPRVVSGGGTVAGLPTSLIVELIGAAVAKRL